MSASIKSALRALAPIGTLAALLLGGYLLLFTHFMVYDDEGYVLWSLRNYVAEGGLYTRVYSQYGPLFYAAYDALHRVTGFEFTNASARWITLVYWCATAWLAGGIAWRLTQSTVARVAALALTFAALSAMSSEPIHPGGPLALLTAIGAWWGCRALLRGKPWEFAFGAALAAAAMVMIKINVGVFFLIAAGSWLALHTAASRARSRAIEWLVLFGCVASPLLLMRDRIELPAYAQFALVFAAGAGALALWLRRTPREQEHGAADWAVLAGVFAVGVAVVALAVVARGTTWADLVNGVAIAPLNQPHAYSFPPRWQPAASALALLSLGAAWWTAARGLSPFFRMAIAGLRIAAIVIVAILGLRAIEHSIGSFLFSYGPSLAWLFALPLRTGEARAERARWWLAWVFVWQTLHAFPVAGSQMAWGALLAAPLFALGAHEAILVLTETRVRLRRVVVAAFLLAAFFPAGSLIRTGWIYRQVSMPLQLPGTEHLQLPTNITLALRALSRNAVLHGDTLFSHPGMFSFNLWTGRPTPTSANVTLWSTLLTDAQQDAIRTRLAADPRAVVISQNYVLTHLIERGFAPRGELNGYLVQNFTRAFSIETYVFWVHRSRTIAPVGTASLARKTDEGAGWTVDLITDAGGRPVTWELWTNGAPLRIASGEFSKTNPRQQPIDLAGNSRGESSALAERMLSGELTRVTFDLPTLRLPAVDRMELRLLDADGRIVEQVPFRH